MRVTELPFEFAIDDFSELRIVREQRDASVFIVLGLCEQIRCDKLRARVARRDDRDFRGTGECIDAADSRDRALGGGDVTIAGPGDYVDVRYGLRAVRHGCNCLCAPDLKNFVGPGNRRCGENRVIRPGRADDDALDARDPGGNDAH